MEQLTASDFSLVCRSCLKFSSGMKNMVDWGFADDFYNLTNIRVNKLESMPEMLCEKCEDFIVKCRSFKAQCQESDLLLKDMIQKKLSTLSGGKTNPQDVIENSVYCDIKSDNLVIKITAPDMESKLHLPCPYTCHTKFLKRTDLLNHLIKRHKADKSFPIQIQFYCSISSCNYYINSGNGKYFLGRKNLNQHICKVHKEKIYCHVCNMGYWNESDFNRHLKTCNCIYVCQVCDIQFNTNEKLLIHLIRKHPDLHKQYKSDKRAEKRKMETSVEGKKIRIENDKSSEYICDSPKRSFATQTLDSEKHIKNDVTLNCWQSERADYTKKDEISTQTVFEDLLSLKSQNSDEDSIFFSETVSLSDIQTQTIPLEFGLSRSNKETITSETQSPDLSIKETQTCYCLYDSSKPNLKCADTTSSSSSNAFSMLTSTETQTLDMESDVFSSSTSAETQTYFDENLNKEL